MLCPSCKQSAGANAAYLVCQLRGGLGGAWGSCRGLEGILVIRGGGGDFGSPSTDVTRQWKRRGRYMS